MNILVLGWYHHQNAGDDLMQSAITRWLDGHTLGFLPSGRDIPASMLREWDCLLIGGGGLAMGDGRLLSRLARRARRTGTAVGVIGMSIEGDRPELRRSLDTVRTCSTVFWLRDHGSADWLCDGRELPDLIVLPDLTFLDPLEVLAPATHDALAVNLPAGYPDPQGGWRAALAACGRELVPWPLYFEGAGDAGLMRTVLGDSSPMPDHFSVDPLRKAPVVVAGRFHAMVLAIQSGRPFVAVGNRPKMARFLAQHGLTDWFVPPDRPDNLRSTVDALLDGYDAAAGRVVRLREQLVQELAEKSDSVRGRLVRAGEAASRNVWRRIRRRIARRFSAV